jgi:hypothetical protein
MFVSLGSFLSLYGSSNECKVEEEVAKLQWSLKECSECGLVPMGMHGNEGTRDTRWGLSGWVASRLGEIFIDRLGSMLLYTATQRDTATVVVEARRSWLSLEGWNVVVARDADKTTGIECLIAIRKNRSDGEMERWRDGMEMEMS